MFGVSIESNAGDSPPAMDQADASPNHRATTYPVLTMVRVSYLCHRTGSLGITSGDFMDPNLFSSGYPDDSLFKILMRIAKLP